jgi:trans-aconitate methyltransferase
MLRPNTERLPAGQRWDPEQYRRHGGFVAELGLPVLDLLDPRPGERILDLGCGDGALTAKLAAICSVVGVDASADQVAAARARGLDARVGAGESLDFDEAFDAVFSNAALHWMTEPDAVLAGVARALRPGGRFAGELGGAGNIARVTEAMLAALAARGIDGRALWPWYFPTDDDYRARLDAAGFEVRSIALMRRPTRLPGRMAEWVATFGGRFLDAVAETERAGFLAEVETRLAPALLGADGVWTADYVRLRFMAVKR